MGNLLNVLGHDRDTQILLMSWADKHPYLFTLIQVTNSTTIYVLLTLIGLKLLNMVLRVKRR